LGIDVDAVADVDIDVDIDVVVDVDIDEVVDIDVLADVDIDVDRCSSICDSRCRCRRGARGMLLNRRPVDLVSKIPHGLQFTHLNTPRPADIHLDWD